MYVADAMVGFLYSLVWEANRGSILSGLLLLRGLSTLLVIDMGMKKTCSKGSSFHVPDTPCMAYLHTFG